MNISDEFVSHLKRPVTYLPYLLAPLSIGALYIFFVSGAQENAEGTLMPGSGMHGLPDFFEDLAPYLIGGATFLYWLKAVWTRNLTYVLMLALAACIYLRELHWEPANPNDYDIKSAIYPLLVICAVWFIAWRNIIDGPVRNFRHTVFFVPAVVTYAFAQAIERRTFRFLPHEDVLHTYFEEAVECCAHLLLFSAAAFGSWEKKQIVIQPEGLEKAESEFGESGANSRPK